MEAVTFFLEATVMATRVPEMEAVAFTLTSALAHMGTSPEVASTILLCDVDYHLSVLLTVPCSAVRECALAAGGECIYSTYIVQY